MANWATVWASRDVPWVRVTAVHAQQQVLLEGLAQALPLLAAPHDERLTARVRLDHYLQLVRAELHLAINNGETVSTCVEHARRRVPFWEDDTIFVGAEGVGGEVVEGPAGCALGGQELLGVIWEARRRVQGPRLTTYLPIPLGK